ncbi:acyl-CoA/acyl-ACP dehydrogenase [Rhodococcus sp. Z13]|uniref:Acyl-CoA/acyl-ACP dehydrogenase n=1 Tax=Rhodococcus sacchari TaxID=2962047 RepID=A0ACD4DEV7_9NOCA|nr:acyl-CoA dehydrogenase family protein [Rhodococcus sp. Z13]UYP18605.1 acyl-CoA/acyl-ACP dehydrogenase [Rhodococcus sp. Z13]
MSGHDILETTELRDFAQMLSDLFTPGDDHRIGEVIELDRELWTTLTELGLDRLTGSEATGGSGAGWLEAALLHEAAGGAAAAVPLGENDLLAGWLLETAGLPVEPAVRTAALLDGDGTARHVPWARYADALVVLWDSGEGWRVAEIPRRDVELTESVNLAAEPRDHLRLDTTTLTGAAVPDGVAEQFRYRGALLRALQSVGAMDRILDLTVEHTTARVQFGRPLARFQAVQHLVADIATEASLAHAATDAAIDAVRAGGFGEASTRFAIAAAASCAGHAASVVTRNAHQAFGAIGFTMEHELHRHANRILSWRSEFGTVASWDAELLAAATSAPDVWALIAGGPAR